MTARDAAALWLQRQWYGEVRPHGLLLGLEFLFKRAVALRTWAYARGIKRVERLPVPVIVVGNLTVGGTGKTPLTIWLAEFLKAQGHRPGILSRGYGGLAGRVPFPVGGESDPARAGDEPVLIARRTGCPLFVGRARFEAGRALLATNDCDVLIADDGLQHYALARDIEIAVVDGRRGFGNGRCLPAGPLRETPDRLRRVDLVVCSGGGTTGGYAMSLEGAGAFNLKDEGLRRSLAEFRGSPLHAVAAIGNPDRFFDYLRGHGLTFQAHPFPDHYRFRKEDLAFGDAAPILMTEKDAVKCRAFAAAEQWFVPVSARLPDAFGSSLLKLLKAKCDGQKTA